MADIEYLNRFENKLQEALLRLCTSYHMLDGTLLASDDIDLHWKKLAPEYMADAVPQVREYPTVSVAWAAYLGMAVAFVVSILAIKFLMSYIKRHDFKVFGWYRIALGALVLVLFSAGFLRA